MKHVQTFSRIWQLWADDLDAMAAATGMQASALDALRSAGNIPPEGCDDVILARATEVGKPLTAAGLRQRREVEWRALDMDQRKACIRNTVRQLGGAKVAARRIGCTRNAVQIAMGRGHLPKRHKYEWMKLFAEEGVTVPEEIFTVPSQASAPIWGAN